jgi:glycyl-tRNA synthetase beta chain
VVALAERLELLLSIFAKGERPSGSSDPYALRRAGNGLLLILQDRGWRLDLPALLGRACRHWAELLPHSRIVPEALATELAEFLCQRLQSLLEEEGFDPDLVQAVAGEGLPLKRVLQDPSDARSRCRLLQSLRGDGELAAVQEVVQRAARLAEKSDLAAGVLSPEGVVDALLFEKESEVAMLAVLRRLEPIAAGPSPTLASGAPQPGAPAVEAAGSPDEAPRYAQLARSLADSAPTLAAFFDGPGSVLVMADDVAVRANRLRLLAVLRNQALVLADFSRLSG